MGEVLPSLSINLLAALVFAGITFLLYFSADIYFLLTRKDFGRVNIYIVHFTRNDFGRDLSRKGDALNLRFFASRVSLKQIYPNRFVLWRVLRTAMRAKRGNVVLDFKQHARTCLKPMQGFLAEMCRDGELKRSAGMPFKETKYNVFMLNDKLDEDKDDVLRVLLVRDVDLQRFKKYRNAPPVAQRYFYQLCAVDDAYRNHPGTHIDVRMTVA
jgi:hypothetical protein